MQIIDKQGMIFGKINIIDLLVIIFILSLTPMFWFGYKLAHKSLPSESLLPPPINWEQKYNQAQLDLNQTQLDLNEEKVNCEQRRIQDLEGWQKRYNEEITQKEELLKKHPRLKKYFK